MLGVHFRIEHLKCARQAEFGQFKLQNPLVNSFWNGREATSHPYFCCLSCTPGGGGLFFSTIFFLCGEVEKMCAPSTFNEWRIFLLDDLVAVAVKDITCTVEGIKSLNSPR